MAILMRGVPQISIVPKMMVNRCSILLKIAEKTRRQFAIEIEIPIIGLQWWILINRRLGTASAE
jgi:hypothetical protein